MFSCNVNDVCCACTKYVYTCTSQSEYLFAGVREWNKLPSEVYECFLSIKTGFKTRFNQSSFLLTDAALVHPGHKSLSWLEPTRREEAIQQFKYELLIVAGIEGLSCSSKVAIIIRHSEDAEPNQSAQDEFFDFEVSNVTLYQYKFQLNSMHSAIDIIVKESETSQSTLINTGNPHIQALFEGYGL